MHQRIAQTLRYFATLTGQLTARSNAAEGSATLRKRRHDQEDADEYLRGRLLTFPPGETETGEAMSREQKTPCEHEWSLVRVEDTWSGPMLLSVCMLCDAMRREWLTEAPEVPREIPLPRLGSDLPGTPVVPVIDTLP